MLWGKAGLGAAQIDAPESNNPYAMRHVIAPGLGCFEVDLVEKSGHSDFQLLGETVPGWKGPFMTTAACSPIRQNSFPFCIRMDGLISKGITLYQSGKFKDVEAVCREILGAAPGDADAMHLLGLSLFEFGDQDEGEAWLRKAASLRPETLRSISASGICFRPGGAGEAETCFETVIALNPNHADAHYNLANLYLSGEECSKKPFLSSDALRLNPERVGAWHNRGSPWRAREKTAARDCYKRAVRSTPNRFESKQHGVAPQGIRGPVGARTCFQGG